jgi:hypothetical protein
VSWYTGISGQKHTPGVVSCKENSKYIAPVEDEFASTLATFVLHPIATFSCTTQAQGGVRKRTFFAYTEYGHRLEVFYFEMLTSRKIGGIKFNKFIALPYIPSFFRFCRKSLLNFADYSDSAE